MRRHGYRSTYNDGCRCDACRAANRYYAQARYDRHRDASNPETPEGPAPPGRWVEQAVCQGASTDEFFPGRGANIGHLRTLCARCPVQPECLAWALTHSQQLGFIGGRSERERRRLRNPAQPDTSQVSR